MVTMLVLGFILLVGAVLVTAMPAASHAEYVHGCENPAQRDP